MSFSYSTSSNEDRCLTSSPVQEDGGFVLVGNSHHDLNHNVLHPTKPNSCASPPPVTRSQSREKKEQQDLGTGIVHEDHSAPQERMAGGGAKWAAIAVACAFILGSSTLLLLTCFDLNIWLLVISSASPLLYRILCCILAPKCEKYRAKGIVDCERYKIGHIRKKSSQKWLRNPEVRFIKHFWY